MSEIHMGIALIDEAGFREHNPEYDKQFSFWRAWRRIKHDHPPINEALFFQAVYECRPIHLHQAMKQAFNEICPNIIIPDLQNLIFQYVEEPYFSEIPIVNQYENLQKLYYPVFSLWSLPLKIYRWCMNTTLTTIPRPTLTQHEQQLFRSNILPGAGIHTTGSYGVF